MTGFLNNLLILSLDAAPWLVLGLLIGGLIKAWIPTDFLQRHLSGKGISSILKAAFFGAPLPLCSCGVIPAALGLRRAGASKPATIAFLVSTPETGVDSVSISYALLGPFMAVVRPIAAIVSAITAGLLVGRSEDDVKHVNASLATSEKASCCETDKVETTCCSVSANESKATSCCNETEDNHQADQPSCDNKPADEVNSCNNNDDDKKANCCAEELTAKKHVTQKESSTLNKAWKGIHYSFTDLLDNVLFWLIIGLVFAAVVKTFVPETFLASWGSGIVAMLVMLVIGIPMYVCATASTPIAAGLMLAGVSPGTALVFLMAGPATNIATLGIIHKELGRRPLIAYLSGVSVIALLSGLIVDALVKYWNIDVQAQLSSSHDMIPAFIAWACLLLLIAIAVKLKLAK